MPPTHTGEPRATEPRRAIAEALYEMKRVIVGQDEMLERMLVALLAGGHVLLEGVPGLAKTLTVKTMASVLGGSFRRDPVHPGPRALRPGRHAHLASGHRALRHRARTGVRQLPPRRRDQPRAGEGAVGAAGGHAGAAGDDRRRDLPRPDAVPRARHAEPDRVRGHLSPAGGPDRPVPHEGARRLPERGRGGRGGRAIAGRRGERARARDPRRPRAPHAGDGHGVRRPFGHRLRRHARGRHAHPRALRPGRAGSLRRVRGEPARADRARARRPRPGAAARSRARRRRRHPRPRRRCPAPPPRALLRRARRRGERRRHPRADPRHRAGAGAPPVGDEPAVESVAGARAA